MTGQKVFIVVFTAARNRDHMRTALPQNGAHRCRSAARPEHKGFFAFRGKVSGVHQSLKTAGIRVVAEDAAIAAPQQGIYAADGAGGFGQLIAERNDRFLIRDRHIQAVPVAAADKVLHLVRRFLIQQVLIIPQFRMDLR